MITYVSFEDDSSFNVKKINKTSPFLYNPFLLEGIIITSIFLSAIIFSVFETSDARIVLSVILILTINGAIWVNIKFKNTATYQILIMELFGDDKIKINSKIFHKQRIRFLDDKDLKIEVDQWKLPYNLLGDKVDDYIVEKARDWLTRIEIGQ